MSFVKNPVRRIYLHGDTYPGIRMEIELPEEFKQKYQKNSKVIVLKTDDTYHLDDAHQLFDLLLKAFGITVKKSDISGVTFVNMFCSDKDAKISDLPEPLQKGKGVLLP